MDDQRSPQWCRAKRHRQSAVRKRLLQQCWCWFHCCTATLSRWYRLKHHGLWRWNFSQYAVGQNCEYYLAAEGSSATWKDPLNKPSLVSFHHFFKQFAPDTMEVKKLDFDIRVERVFVEQHRASSVVRHVEPIREKLVVNILNCFLATCLRSASQKHLLFDVEVLDSSCRCCVVWVPEKICHVAWTSTKFQVKNDKRTARWRVSGQPYTSQIARCPVRDLWCSGWLTLFQNLAPRGASDLEPLWLRIQHYQPNWRQKLTETVNDSAQCNRDSVVKSVKTTQSWCYSHEISAQMHSVKEWCTNTNYTVPSDSEMGPWNLDWWGCNDWRVHHS